MTLMARLRELLRPSQVDIKLMQHIRHEGQRRLLCHLATGALRFSASERPECRMPLVRRVVHKSLHIEVERACAEVVRIYVQQSRVEDHLISLPEFEAVQFEVLGDMAK